MTGIAVAEPAGVLARYGTAVAADQLYPIAGARAFLVDHGRLLADFEQLHPEALLADNPELAGLAEPQRCALLRIIAERWLVANAGLVGQAQLAPSGAHTEIRTDGDPRPAVRPPRYGRACIVEAAPCVFELPGLREPVRVAGGGELDIKGVGVPPGHRSAPGEYTDGLLPLAEALREYLIERLIDAVFCHAGATAFRTLPHYGIVDTGFDGFAATGLPFPAAIAVRRAHLRDLESDLPRGYSADQYLAMDIELLLRRYGITSSKWDAYVIRQDPDRLRIYSGQIPFENSAKLVDALVSHFGFPLPFVADRVNVQMDADQPTSAPVAEESRPRSGAGRHAAAEPASVRQVLDFGHYGVRAGFDRPLVSMVSDRPLGWGGMLLPSDDCFAQPDPALVPRLDWWQEACQPRATLFGALGERLAAAFRRDELTAADIGTHAEAVLAEISAGWPPNPAGS